MWYILNKITIPKIAKLNSDLENNSGIICLCCHKINTQDLSGKGWINCKKSRTQCSALYRKQITASLFFGCLSNLNYESRKLIFIPIANETEISICHSFWTIDFWYVLRKVKIFINFDLTFLKVGNLLLVCSRS